MAERKKRDSYLGNPNLPTAFAQHEYDEFRAKELLRCKDDMMHFAENYFYIVHPDDGRIKIPLRNYQKRVLKKVEKNRFFIVCSPRQVGKALALDTPIPTPTGWTTMGELKDGDIIFGRDGNQCRVVKAHDIRYDRVCYEVEFDNGEKIIADAEHNWFTQTRNDRENKRHGGVRTTEEIFNTLNVYKSKEPNHRIPSCVIGLTCDEVDLPIDPYLLGLWLGDGNCASGTITVGKRDYKEIITNLEKYDEQFDIITKYYSKTGNGVASVKFNSKNGGLSLSMILKKEGILNNKHIPQQYLRASRQQRVELLKGLIDSDGYITPKGTVQFYNTNINLTIQVKELIESLGYKTTYKTMIPKLYGKECSMCGIITFTAREMLATLSFKTSRIKENFVEQPVSKLRNQWHYIKNVKVADSVPVRCITVDSPDSLFLCGKTLIPTHNTAMYTIAALHHACFNADKRIVIIANKEATAIEIFKRVKLAYEELPNWLKPGVDGAYGATSMKLANGSEISISTTTGSAARGMAISLLILDELAFVDPPSILEDFWRSVFPTISSAKKSKILIASTPNGVGNLFHKLWTGAINGENGFEYDMIEWDEPPGRDEEFKQKTIQAVGYEGWLQEYQGIFLDFGDGAVDHELFDRLKQGCYEPKYVLEDGSLKIFEPYEEGNIYCAGIDTAEGIGKDSSVIQIFNITDLQDIRQVSVYSSNRVSVYEFTTKAFEILNQWGRPIVCIERNGVGAQVADRFKLQLGYENVVSWGGHLAKRTQQIGMISHSNTKPKAVQNMRYWMNELKCVKLADINTLKELKEFTRKPNGLWSAKSGFHDDLVTSMMWCLMVLFDEICVQYFEIEDRDDNGKPKKISATDWGLISYVNPHSIYTPAALDSIDISLAPVIFGFGNEQDIDENELHALGWRPLGF